jgi:hypothetical protein
LKQTPWQEFYDTLVFDNWLDAFHCDSALDGSFTMASTKRVEATLLIGDNDDRISDVPLEVVHSEWS